uniref:Arginine deiminase n=1 Tax=Chlamydomonas leiostraca TaxID=1034604 RepID=A0A7S0RB30_9CHLO
MSTVCTLLESNRKAVQEHENEMAEVVIVCEPEQASLMMGGLHPRGSLYERPINIDTAKAQHAEFRNQLRAHGVRVLTVREILAYNVEDNVSARVDLEDLAFSALDYEMAAGHKVDELAKEDRKFISDDYKREVIEKMGVGQLVDTIMTNPTVHLTPSHRDTGLFASYTFEPLSNLVYTRDQQITTCKGIVMGRLRSQQRQREVQVMKFCITKLGLNVVGEIREPGFLEGGDFFPLGADLAMLGIGLRSNAAAASQLMEEDLLGTRRFAVVRDDFDQDQDRMHLDCVFSVLSDTCCIMLENIMGEASPTRRLVDEYERDPATGKYKMVRQGVELAAYMRGEGYHIVPITAEHQLAYACNVLNLGDSRVISVHAPSARQIVKSPHFKGDVRVIDFSSITSMYGSVHCASQVVRRMPRRLMPTPAQE